MTANFTSRLLNAGQTLKKITVFVRFGMTVLQIHKLGHFLDNLNELLSSPCLEALSALHSANFMPRRLGQPDRIDNLSSDSFNPHCPSPPSLAAHSFVLPQSATQPRPMPREKGRGNNARRGSGLPEVDLRRCRALLSSVPSLARTMWKPRPRMFSTQTKGEGGRGGD